MDDRRGRASGSGWDRERDGRSGSRWGPPAEPSPREWGGGRGRGRRSGGADHYPGPSLRRPHSRSPSPGQMGDAPAYRSRHSYSRPQDGGWGGRRFDRGDERDSYQDGMSRAYDDRGRSGRPGAGWDSRDRSPPSRLRRSSASPPPPPGFDGSKIRDYAAEPASADTPMTSSNATPLNPGGPTPSRGLDGVPTGPRAASGRGGWGGRGGGPPGAGRGGPSPWGGHGAGYSPGSRGGRGAPGGSSSSISIRGRGRGGGYHGTTEEPPARSLSRKLDAGGNALMPDLIPLRHQQQQQEQYGSQETQAASESSRRPLSSGGEPGEIEEGEAREEGEMPATDTGPTGSYFPPQKSHEEMREEKAAPYPADTPQRSGQAMSLGSLPSRSASFVGQPSSSHGPGVSTGGLSVASGSSTPAALSTPGTAAAAAVATPSASVINPYARGRADSTAASSNAQATPGGVVAGTPGATPRVPGAPLGPSGAGTAASRRAAAATSASTTGAPSGPTLTPASFPRSVHPEWDVEIFSSTQLRMAALDKLSTSLSFAPTAAAIGEEGATPTNEVGPKSSGRGRAHGQTSLRKALLDLKDAQMEMEMAAFRHEETEKSGRAEAV